MKILLTGATGYIGKRLIPILIENGHHVVCGVRDVNRFQDSQFTDYENLQVIQLDCLKLNLVNHIPTNIDVAYYLIHSMSEEAKYQEIELQCAKNMRIALEKTNVKQVIYLSGIVNEKVLSQHLSSRLAVESELAKGTYSLTTLRAGIIIGSGSASFEIIRDLVEKLPIMITPKWLNTKCQPIGINDVLQLLHQVLLNPPTYNKNFDIGGPDVLTYKQMLLQYAQIRGLKRTILTVPVMTPKLSSYWLYFVTSTSYMLAQALVNSMKIEVICRNNELLELLNYTPLSYQGALKRTVAAVDSNHVISSWKDALASGVFTANISEYIQVPTHGCFVDHRCQKFENRSSTIHKIFAIGGENGWYYGDWMWKLRGFIDKVFGGVGLRRGRTSATNLSAGDALDFWRVLYANKEEGRLLLFAEMKLPGEAWLEFKITHNQVEQTATFRPKGLLGRLYWYSVLPFHSFVFNGMLSHITAKSQK